MSNLLTPEVITYQTLSDALSHLGFKTIITSEFLAFRHAELDAYIILPPEDLSQPLSPLHRAAARATVAGKGVAPPAEFDRLLTPAAQPAVSARAANGVRIKKKAKKQAAMGAV